MSGKQILWLLLAAALLAGRFAPAADAAPWDRLLAFRQVEADPDKSYSLTEENGPWMILASSFAGPGAETQAHHLALELRKEYNLEAFVHRKTYDFSKPVVGLGLNRYGGPKIMRYANAAKFDEIAVLVGHFGSADDSAVDDERLA